MGTAGSFQDLMQPDGIRMEFQPIVTLRSGEQRLYALEALARGPRGSNFERPDVMFEYARRRGEEAQLDMVCIARAFASARCIPGEPRISLNVHGSALSDVPHFADIITVSSIAHGIDPRRLIVEIVEHRAAWTSSRVRSTLQDLRNAGIRIALDDLGVGESNYDTFIECRPDHLKIDKNIVHGSATDRYRRAVLHSIVALGQRSGAICIAEGVEDECDLAAVREAGIECIQGWLYGKSVPAEELTHAYPWMNHH